MKEHWVWMVLFAAMAAIATAGIVGNTVEQWHRDELCVRTGGMIEGGKCVVKGEGKP